MTIPAAATTRTRSNFKFFQFYTFCARTSRFPRGKRRNSKVEFSTRSATPLWMRRRRFSTDSQEKIWFWTKIRCSVVCLSKGKFNYDIAAKATLSRSDVKRCPFGLPTRGLPCRWLGSTAPLLLQNSKQCALQEQTIHRKSLASLPLLLLTNSTMHNSWPSAQIRVQTR